MVNVKGRERRGPQKAAAGFVYRARSAETVKKRAEQKGGRFDSMFKSNVDTWRPKSGVNRVRILPPTWDDFEHYGYRVFVHKFVGPDNSTYLCPSKMLNKKCPICRVAKETRDAGEEDEAKKLQAVEQFSYYIIDREAKGSPKPEIFTVSWTMDRDIAKLTIDSRTGKILLIDHPDEGFDLTFERDGLGLKTRYSAYRIDREASPISEDEAEQEEILQSISENPISEMLQFYPAEYLQNMMDGTGGEKDEDLDEEETVAAKPNGKRRPVAAAAEEEEVEEEEVEEAPPPRKGKVLAKVKARQPEPEEEEEEEEPPPRGKVKPKVKAKQPEPEEEEEQEPEDGEEVEEEEVEEGDESGDGDEAEEEEEVEEEVKPRRTVSRTAPVGRRR